MTHLFLYADDILIFEQDPRIAQRVVEIIREKGLEYGLEFNEQKFEMMTINGEESISVVDGSYIKRKDVMVYLGSVISKNGSM